jgi:RNA polymerase-binding transcription factor DksA
LENALIRIKNGTYGICVDTGKLIAKDRLKAVPHTMHSIEAKLAKK